MTRLHYVEFDLRPPMPSPKVLAGWKKHRSVTQDGFVYGVVAPSSLYGDPSWPMRDAAALRSELDRLANNLDALGASVLVLRTPLAVSPGSVALQRLTPVFERTQKLGVRTVWDPSGPWERRAAVAHASQFGVLVASDPLHDSIEDEAVVYARMRGLGFDRRYHASRLEEMAETLSACDTAYVVFDSSSAWREAVGFRAMIQGVDAAQELDDDDDLDDEDDSDDDLDDDEDED